jgi:hypothetical protein
VETGGFKLDLYVELKKELEGLEELVLYVKCGVFNV